MKTSMRYLCIGAVLTVSGIAQANLLLNGNLDVTYQQEIVPGFTLPKPFQWENVGSRSLTGPYEDELSSEPWAGPAPTPVTTDGFDQTNGFNGQDWGVFFKAFTGGPTTGAATGHLYQDVAGTAFQSYTLSGWAGGEANVQMRDAQLAIEFLDGGKNIIGGSTLSMISTLVTPNGQAFNYKKYSVTATAPGGTVWVRSRVSMIDGTSNPLGGGQAYVVDDFDLSVVPEPVSMIALAGGILAMAKRRKASK